MKLALSLALLIVCAGDAAVIIIPGPGAKHSAGGSISDDFEAYTSGSGANGLSGGSGFAGAYADRANITGIQSVDDMELYADGANVSGLNSGGFGGAYVDRINLTGVKALETGETYSDGASLNSLNGGTGWAGAFVDR